MKVFYLTDGAGWIVDSITQELSRWLVSWGHKVEIKTYNGVSERDFVLGSASSDIVHIMNWQVDRVSNWFDKVNRPIVVSVRSHRYPAKLKELGSRVKFLAVNERISRELGGVSVIPDGVFDLGVRPFVVGCVYHPGSSEYKGVGLIREACKRLGLELIEATGQYRDMREFYRKVNLVVVASEAEGFNTPAMEAACWNIPVVSTDSGYAQVAGATIVDRNVDSIMEGIRKHYTRPNIFPRFTWEQIAEEHLSLYKGLMGI